MIYKVYILNIIILSVLFSQDWDYSADIAEMKNKDGQKIKQFDGNEILAVAAYNAGAGRVRNWMKRFGDPRSPELDPLVWIELIPFSETRNYVKRVIAADAIYRAKYTGQNISFRRLKKNLGY